jgi:hypothetical protein
MSHERQEERRKLLCLPFSSYDNPFINLSEAGQSGILSGILLLRENMCEV